MGDQMVSAGVVESGQSKIFVGGLDRSVDEGGYFGSALFIFGAL
jgi:hypothetical protein